MYGVTFIADEGHLGVMRCVVKGIFLLGILASSGMALEAGTHPEGVAQVGGFSVRAHKIGHGVAGGQGFDDYFISDGGANVTVNAFDVLVTFEIVGRGQGNPLALHWMKFGKFFFMEMAGRAERVVLLQVVSDHDAPPKRYSTEQGYTHQEEG
jgi:hypothetical protein